MLVVLAAAGVVLAVGFGPLVRAQVSAEAARRHLNVQVGHVRPGWFAVRLLDVAIAPEGASSVRARLDEVRISVGVSLRLERVALHGGNVTLAGASSQIEDDVRRWQAKKTAGDGGTRHPAATIAWDAIEVQWVEQNGAQPRFHARAVIGSRDDDLVRVGMADVRLGFAHGVAACSALSAEFTHGGELARMYAGSVSLEFAFGDAAPSPPRDTEGVVAAAAPLVSLPDLKALRERTRGVGQQLARALPEGAEIRIDSLTWKLSQQGTPLTVGPGPLTATRNGSRVEVRFSTEPSAASTPIAIRVLSPLDDGDAAATLEGGPVSLALLGVKEQALGLVDVGRATVTGRARIVLSGDGESLTFDAEAIAKGLSIQQSRLAPDVVRGLDLALRMRGAVTAGGELRLDDVAATAGALHVEASGALHQKADHVSSTFHFEVPNAACQAMFDSVPTALLPALAGTRLAGTFGARGRFAFDSRSLDELELKYEMQDQCRVVDVPAALERERFKQPFAHRIYLPDGTVGEQTTGPGSPNWTPLEAISPYMQVAVLTTEDGGFSRHHGFNHAAIRASIVANLKARRFVRGASTITMQLAKNLFLTREKTLSRKLQELVLTDYLEQVFSKDELMELYLNIVEFGPSVYGVAAAADHYFGRRPAELNLAECLFLSSLLPAPIRYGTMHEAGQPPEGWMRTIHALMRIAHKTGLISESELAEGQNEPIVFWRGGPRPEPRPAVHARPLLPGENAVDAPGTFDAPDE